MQFLAFKGQELGVAEDDCDEKDIPPSVVVVIVEGGLVREGMLMEMFLDGVNEASDAEDGRREVMPERLLGALWLCSVLLSCEFDLGGDEGEKPAELGVDVRLGLVESVGEESSGVFDEFSIDGVFLAVALASFVLSEEDFVGGLEECLSESVGLAVFDDADFEGDARDAFVTGFLGPSVGLKVTAGLEDFGFGSGVLLAFGSLLFVFLDLLLGGFGSTGSPGFALSGPKGIHFDNKSHSLDYVGVSGILQRWISTYMKFLLPKRITFIAFSSSLNA